MIIIGGTGFIGRHLCQALVARGRKACVVSRTPDFSFIEEFAPGFGAVELERIMDHAEQYFESASTLIYLASTSVPATFGYSPWGELIANVQPAFELFDRALKANPNLRVIFLSSGGTVYGGGHDVPIVETAPLKPISPYGYGKVAIEEALRFLNRTRGLNYAILRVSNPVGCWQANRAQGIITVAMRTAWTGGTLHLFDKGRQVRDFIDAGDLAEAIILAADARDFSEETWNIGSGIGRNISEVIDLVSQVMGCQIHCVNMPARPVDVLYSVLDCSKVRRDLGWSAQTPLEDSIRSIYKVWSSRVFRR